MIKIKSVVVSLLVINFIGASVISCGVAKPKAGQKTLGNNGGNENKTEKPTEDKAPGNNTPAEDNSQNNGASQAKDGSGNGEAPIADGSSTERKGNIAPEQTPEAQAAAAVAETDICGKDLKINDDILNNEELKKLNLPLLLSCSAAIKTAKDSKLSYGISADKTTLNSLFEFGGVMVELVTTSKVQDKDGALLKVESETVPAEFKIVDLEMHDSCAVELNKFDPTGVKRKSLSFKIEGLDYSFQLISRRADDKQSQSCLNDADMTKIVNELVRIQFPAN